jgi:Flp pilus assembly protein CpaB
MMARISSVRKEAAKNGEDSQMTDGANPVDPVKVQLAWTMGTLLVALREALDEIGRMKGAAADAWLDDFEKDVINGAKNTVPHGISMEQEIIGVDAAVATVRDVIKVARGKLPKQNS